LSLFPTSPFRDTFLRIIETISEAHIQKSILRETFATLQYFSVGQFIMNISFYILKKTMACVSFRFYKYS
jgi:hypothetical protein